ncbi:glycosyl hydrolase 108 family protein [Paracoccus sp. pheM1]|uniref:glycoside hydrolase family 108 protein n=1 Tax=Paracoccus sp. pheM1 TaxID=2831675 RepID=UPI001BDB8D44|nr:glycosyl hydrolase 108 family protein [Paracoccus sp. pheM1]MBT0780590.1 hypothetical protein [Paracoccus sp. pheM1]
MKSNFDRCLAEVLRHEGGYVNDPHDPGGETNMGISKRSYPNENIKGMTRARAAEIYRRDYWNPVRGDDLPAGLDLVAFDAAVNSGVSRGAKWLQSALGAPADGKIGPQTLAAAKAAHPEAVIDRATGARLAWLRTLKTWSRYGKGWTRRVESVREKAIAMSKATTPNATEPAAPSGFIAALLALFKSMFGGKA